MSLPRYAQYKDSGEPLLGDLPAHWTATSIKRCFTIYGGSTPKSDEAAYWDGEIVWVSPADLSKLSSIYIDDSARKISQAGLESCGTTLVPEGSIVLSTRAPIGSLAIAKTELCTNQGCKSLVPRSDINEAFYAYYLLASTEALNLRGKGTTFLELSADELGVFKAPRPPFDEQSAIAAFLDRETAKIDALIAEQEKLLALLAEKRQATISHAVTRGLNSDAPMKASGVAWLGAVPTHWEVKRLKSISPSITVGIVVNPSDYVSEEGLPYVYGGDISEGKISTDTCRKINPEDSRRQPKTRLEAGDLLTVRVGAPGVTAVVPESCVGGNCASVMLVRKGRFNSTWLCYAMNSRMVRYQVEVVQYGAAQEQFNISHAINFWIATPPESEQVDIAFFLDKEIDKINMLKSECECSIDLLKERRSVLIAAAVSGRIDVRNAVPQEMAA